MPAPSRTFRLLARLAVYAAAALVVLLAPDPASTSFALRAASEAPAAASDLPVRVVLMAVLLAGVFLEIGERRIPWR